MISKRIDCKRPRAQLRVCQHTAVAPAQHDVFVHFVAEHDQVVRLGQTRQLLQSCASSLYRPDSATVDDHHAVAGSNTARTRSQSKRMTAGPAARGCSGAGNAPAGHRNRRPVEHHHFPPIAGPTSAVMAEKIASVAPSVIVTRACIHVDCMARARLTANDLAERRHACHRCVLVVARAHRLGDQFSQPRSTDSREPLSEIHRAKLGGAVLRSP